MEIMCFCKERIEEGDTSVCKDCIVYTNFWEAKKEEISKKISMQAQRTKEILKE